MSHCKTSETYSQLETETSFFAATYIKNRNNLFHSNIFPDDLWKEMGKKQLLGICIDKKYGGKGLDLPEITHMARILSQKGECLGVTLSWGLHLLVSRLVNSYGTEDQKEMLLPDLVNGKRRICIAVSEPDAGAHPKYLKSTAIEQKEGYLLNGKKIWVTNAPVADVFIVITITKNTEYKKYYSALIVTKDTPGVSVSDPFDMPFFRPSPHGEVIFKECMISKSMILGEPHTAYEKMVIPFSTIENTFMMGSVAGGIKALFDNITTQITPQKTEITETLLLKLGELETMVNVLETISYEGAHLALTPLNKKKSDSIWIFFRKLAQETLSQLQEIITVTDIISDNTFEQLKNDLISSSNIAQKALKTKQIKLGKGVLSEKNRV